MNGQRNFKSESRPHPHQHQHQPLLSTHLIKKQHHRKNRRPEFLQQLFHCLVDCKGFDIETLQFLHELFIHPPTFGELEDMKIIATSPIWKNNDEVLQDIYENMHKYLVKHHIKETLRKIQPSGQSLRHRLVVITRDLFKADNLPFWEHCHLDKQTKTLVLCIKEHQDELLVMIEDSLQLQDELHRTYLLRKNVNINI
jgi:hypothetical protein